MQYSSYHDLLNDHFERRKNINNAYSLRAYARDLGISSARLSQVLGRKHGLSIEAAQALASKLKLSSNETKWFIESVGALHSRDKKAKDEYSQKIQEYKRTAKKFSEIHLEYFKVISDWYHFAILELTYLDDFQNDHEWMARKLDISVEEVSDAIARLKNLDLVVEEDGKLKDVFKFLATSNDVPSASLKKFHQQLMKKAMEALYEQDVLNREISSNIFSIRKEKLPEFKEKIRVFRRDMESEASQIKGKDAVYCLSMQFYELTRSKE